MRKFVFLLIMFVFVTNCAFAAKIPNDVKNFVKKEFPKSEMRFDGLITCQDGTLYLPLIPSLIKTPQKLEVKEVYPQGTSLVSKPDVIIFNNDYVFLKVLDAKNGSRTVMYFDNPPIEIKTGLLPQDMLVPRGLIVHDNIKGIIGGLSIQTSNDKGLRVKSTLNSQSVIKNTQKPVSKNTLTQLANKTFYITTFMSKDIQVVESTSSIPSCALSQKTFPIDIKAVNNDKLLLVSSYKSTILNVVSLADEAVIKSIDLHAEPAEILIDAPRQKAYITSPSSSYIFLVDLPTMQLKQKIKVNGRCEKLAISPNGTILFYKDKYTNEVWSVELANNYLLRDIGQFPNVSKIVFEGNKLYLASRTKHRVAVFDYLSMSLLKEIEVPNTPVDMIAHKGNIFVLSASKDVLSVINVATDNVTSTINLGTNGFATRITKLNNTNLILITNAKPGKYSVVDLDKKQVIKTGKLDIPVASIAVVEKVRKINK